MKLIISLPSFLNEGETLPLKVVVAGHTLAAPQLSCGFDTCDSTFELRPEAGDWLGVANVRSAHAGLAFLKFRLSTPSHTHQQWTGELTVRIAQRQQAAPVHLTGVNNQAEKSGMGQANSVNITINSVSTTASPAQSIADWQTVELLLAESTVTAATPPPSPSHQVEPTAHKPTPEVHKQPSPVYPHDVNSHHKSKPLHTVALGNSKIIGVALLLLIGTACYLLISNNEKKHPAQVASHTVKTPADSSEKSAKSKSETSREKTDDESIKPLIKIDAKRIAPSEQADIEVRGLATTYRQGDVLKMEVRLSKSGYLRLQSLDESGEIGQLYPTKLDSIKNHPAGTWISLPDPKVLAEYPKIYECLVLSNKFKETTHIRLQWSPVPFDLSGLRSVGEVFYEPDQPTTWKDVATRGVRLNLEQASIVNKELSFEVVR